MFKTGLRKRAFLVGIESAAKKSAASVYILFGLNFAQIRDVASRNFFFFWGGGWARANNGGAKLFIYCDENDGIKCLYRNYTRIPYL